MSDRFHAGERSVQSRVGVTAMAEKIGTGIRPEIAAPAQHFLAAQDIVFIGAADSQGAMWATTLTGAPGFVSAEDERTLRIAGRLADGDPLHEALSQGSAIGLIAIDLATRRRFRVNGVVVESTPSQLRLRSEQAYGNCPKYIQRRELPARAAAAAPVSAWSGHSLEPAHRAWIAASDTFFIATAHPNAGADVSHRGGNPGFVRVVDAQTLLWPDYAGNTMFQTLGNLEVSPTAGLLFLDFEHGSTLHLTGTATVLWDDALKTEFLGAERLVRFTIARGVELRGTIPAGWRLIDRSPFNPD